MKMSQEVAIGDKRIGLRHRPFIVAEMSANHNQSLQRALDIVEAAAASGAQALKLQTYRPDTITLDIDKDAFRITDPNSLWHGRTLFDLYAEGMTPWEWHEPIMRRCRDLGMLCFSTPFDHSAVDFLESLEVPCYKVASFELIDIPLIRKIAGTRKPMIVSTGMASIEEIQELVDEAANYGCRELILLKCTSSYPASPEETDLRTIPDMATRFGVPVGLSDHTRGIGAALAAISLGAVLVEKHFTLARSDGGPDAPFSIEPAELKALVEESERGWLALGQINYGRSPAEERSALYRRSLFVARHIRKGELFTDANIKSVRPSGGLLPKHLDEVIGKRAARDIEPGTPFNWDLIE